MVLKKKMKVLSILSVLSFLPFPTNKVNATEVMWEKHFGMYVDLLCFIFHPGIQHDTMESGFDNSKINY